MASFRVIVRGMKFASAEGPDRDQVLRDVMRYALGYLAEADEVLIEERVKRRWVKCMALRSAEAPDA